MAATGNTASSPQQASASIDVFITDELRRRGPRKADPLQEKLALQDLARQMSEQPTEVLPHLVDRAMTITRGAAAGISLYEQHPEPGAFRWHYLRGSLAAFDGTTTPRHFSPCGVCLDRAEPTLTQHPERIYTWMAEAGIVAPELLLVPLYLGGALPLGTLWVLADRVGHFDRGHARALSELAAFAGMAVTMLRTEERLQKSLARQELLAQEMSHRVKNLFMLVNGMIQVSARSAATPAEMAQTLAGRVKALAEAHALVQRTLPETEPPRPISDLAQLLNKILDPHEIAAAGPTRFRLDGPLVSLGERATNGFALVCHELATNAAKYGALTCDRGSVRIAWQMTDDGFLALNWQERGGPVVAAPPVSSGFGTRLANETIQHELGGTIVYDWQPDGLVLMITVPAGRL